jgi:uncharacterized SAM-binding protein YcdF (DUF218 family)
MADYQEGTYNQEQEKIGFPKPGPIEPEGSSQSRISLIKWLPILIILIYFGLSYFRIPVLTAIGQYLVVSYPPEKSDLIVCLGGTNVERGLATADAYKMGLAPKIYIVREELPDGYRELKQRGIDYPESIDLLVMILKGLGVPEGAIIRGDVQSRSTWEEAELVKALVERMNYKSIILITSPTHTRRTYLTFRKIMGEKEYRLFIVPSPYSEFKPDTWWQSRRHAREVLWEYQKLLYYTLKGFG